MTDRKKSIKERKIEASLGIGSSDDFDMSDNPEVSEEAEAEAAAAEQLNKRREIATTTKNALAVYSNKTDDKGFDQDEEFSRDMLRDLAVTGMTILKLQEEEMQLDPSARNAETAASLITSVTNAVDKLVGVGHNRKKLDITERKAARQEGPNNITNNFIGVSSFSDLVKNIKDTGENMGIVSNKPKEIESEVVDEDADGDDE